MGPSGFIAVLAGWVVTEVGRQPYTVYGLLRTSDSLSPIAAPALATSLAIFAIVYFIVFGAGTMYILRLMSKAPGDGSEGPEKGHPSHAAGTTPVAAYENHVSKQGAAK